MNVRQVPLPGVGDEEQYRGKRAAGAGKGETDAGGAAIWLFQFGELPSPDDRRDATAA